MNREELQILLMGYLDDELDDEQRARVEAALKDDADLRRALEEMRQLAAFTSAAVAEEAADDAVDRLWGNVYNRLERHTAWILMLGGLLLLAGIALLVFFRDPDTPWLLKAAVAAAGGGALLLLWSVWRERWRILPHDRYHNEVHR